MENEHGVSLLEHTFATPRLSSSDDVLLANILIKSCGREGVKISSICVYLVLCDHFEEERNAQEKLELCIILRMIIRNALDHSFGTSLISELIDVDNTQDYVITTITQQNIWPLELEPTISHNKVSENNRQMLDDPNGDFLRRLLQNINVESYEPLSSYGSPVCALLKCVSLKTSSPELRECCRSRLGLLISIPEFHRFMKYETLHSDADSAYRDYKHKTRNRNHYIGRMAIRCGARPILEVIFQDIGWGKYEVLDFFDQETFYTVPDLLDGRIIYQTSRQMQQDFIVNLCEGVFTTVSKDEVEFLAWQIAHTASYFPSDPYAMRETNDAIKSTVKSANSAFACLNNMPGCWPEEKRIRLVPGVDFQVDDPYGECEEDILRWYKEYIDSDLEKQPRSRHKFRIRRRQ